MWLQHAWLAAAACCWCWLAALLLLLLLRPVARAVSCAVSTNSLLLIPARDCCSH